MSVTTKIRKQGGAAVVTIPPAVLKMMELEIVDQFRHTGDAFAFAGIRHLDHRRLLEVRFGRCGERYCEQQID